MSHNIVGTKVAAWVQDSQAKARSNFDKPSLEYSFRFIQSSHDDKPFSFARF